ncbi:hy [Paenibacillus wynnii]|uniref:Hy n=1 Tax=Paenibacillus wynnii TaxID=268407 RepID=A0A098MF00_9BACL|nr:hy [Paenibacillus wynnii]
MFLIDSVDSTKVSNSPVGTLTVAIGRPVDLGASGNFVILAKAGVSNNPGSMITGNIGVSPIAATAITGFALTLGSGAPFSTSTQVIGQVFAPDYASPTASNLTTAVSNMETAYTDAAGRASNFTELYSGNISGKTLVPGVYKWGTDVLINSGTDVTLNGGPNDVWIFQIAGGLTQASATKIILSGGAKAENIFWQVADTMAIETSAHFEGIVLGKKAITVGTNASINGRLLSQTAVTLDQNTIVEPASASN